VGVWLGGWVGRYSNAKNGKTRIVMCIPVSLFKYSQHLYIPEMNTLYINIPSHLQNILRPDVIIKSLHKICIYFTSKNTHHGADSFMRS
jgi:hypothetical protein